MRILVCGGRDLQFAAWYRRLESELDSLSPTVIIEGGAQGADGLAEIYARARNIPCEEFTAEWKRLGKKAGPIRNQRMIDEGKPDLVVAFPGGKGTADMVRRAEAANLPIHNVL